VLLGATPVLLGAAAVLLGATPVLLGTTTLLAATLLTTTLLPATLLPATLLPAWVLDAATKVLLGIPVLVPGLVAAEVLLIVIEAEKVAFVHWNRTTLLLLLSTANKKSPGNSVV